MRTNKDKLQALIKYLCLNHRMAVYRLWAEQFYEEKDDRAGWEWLFYWAEARDERSEMWKWFQDEYPDAIMLKEGYCD